MSMKNNMRPLVENQEAIEESKESSFTQTTLSSQRLKKVLRTEQNQPKENCLQPARKKSMKKSSLQRNEMKNPDERRNNSFVRRVFSAGLRVQIAFFVLFWTTWLHRPQCCEDFPFGGSSRGGTAGVALLMGFSNGPPPI